MAKWTAADIPDLQGRRAIVTGANSGIGFHTALELARRGAEEGPAGGGGGAGMWSRLPPVQPCLVCLHRLQVEREYPGLER